MVSEKASFYFNLKKVIEFYREVEDARYKKFKGGAYKAINVSIKDETGKNLKRFKYTSHRLIEETLIPNPFNLPEVDHIDRNKENKKILTKIKIQIPFS